MEPKYIAAIEIGSSHIRAAIGMVDDGGTLSVLAVEEENAVDAVRYGCIQNVEEVSNRITRLLRKLENYQNIAPRKIMAVYVAIGGRATSGAGVVVEREFDDETEITPEVLRRLTDEAAAQGASDRSVIEVIPSRFVADNLATANPRGSFVREIRADFNLITCKPLAQRNLVRAIAERQPLKIQDMIVRQSAMADLVLTSDEKKVGCMLVDFGAETTTVSIYKNGCMQYLATLPVGSRVITRDVMTLGYPEEKAEEIKRNIGDAFNVEPNIRKNDFDGDAVEVNNYIRSRAGEIAVNITEQCKYAGLSFTADLPGGIILVGGGTHLRGFSQLLQQQSNVKVRLGSTPSDVRTLDPRFQTIDMLDVIAILYRAAQDPRECTEKPAPAVMPETHDDGDDDDDDYGPGINPRGTKGKKAKAAEEKSRRNERNADTDSNPLGSIGSRMKRFFGGMFNEQDDDDDE